MKITIGHVGHIRVSMADPCGGVVEEIKKTILGASMRSMNRKRTTPIKIIRKILQMSL